MCVGRGSPTAGVQPCERTDKLHTTTILDRLSAVADSPWAGRELTSRKLSRMLRAYSVRPKNVRETGTGPS
ncbi:MAG TPA: DUF3631 domain-containing protein [Micromonosporaceae bacterium]|nr:DUF3631 domain-containing protein [Micromonosporaceae bacterium]